MIPQPLGKNLGGYFGEKIDALEIRRQQDLAAAEYGWLREVIPLPDRTAPLPLEFVAYRREAANPRKRLYLSSGMHGDEPAGSLAMLQLLRENQWPNESIWICPCLNPAGCFLGTRENDQGIDLNRDYRAAETAEVRAHIAWLQRQPQFDLVLCLHEDWEANGFYVYEVNPEHRPSLAKGIIDGVAKVCPIESATVVDDWPAAHGIIAPNINPDERPKWPETLYLIVNNSRQGYTLEAPSDFPLSVRVKALVAGIHAALAQI